jgi:hypothetical protein
MGPDHHSVGSSGWRNWPPRWQAVSAAAALVVILLVGGALVARLDLRGGHALVTATKTPQLSPTIVPTPPQASTGTQNPCHPM